MASNMESGFAVRPVANVALSPQTIVFVAVAAALLVFFAVRSRS
jgi:hypothetical protein